MSFIGVPPHEATHHTGARDALSLDAARITAGRFPLDRLAWIVDKLLKGKGAVANPEEIPIPSSGASLTIAETEVFDGTSPTTWTDLDLSAVVGSNKALVILKGRKLTTSIGIAFRANGDTVNQQAVDTYTGASPIAAYNGAAIGFGVTDTAGIVEWKAEADEAVTITVVGFIK